MKANTRVKWCQVLAEPGPAVRFSVSSDGRKSLFLSEKLKNGSKSFSAKEGKTFPSFSAYKSRSDEKANLRKKY